MTKFIPVIITLLALLVRLPGLGTFMTVDEENWMIRSGEFWNNLFLLNDPGGTFRTSHPGVITMWLGGAGIFLQEQLLGYRVDTSSLLDFRLAATLPIAITTSIFIGVMAFLLVRLAGPIVGAASGLLVAVDPYLVGMSQVIHLDAFLALFMVNAFLSFLLYWHNRNIRYLIAAGALTGLALLNKFYPALWLFVMYAAFMLIEHRGSGLERLTKTFRLGMFLFGVAAFSFGVLWPALLVMKNTTDYFQRDVVTIVQDEHVAYEESSEPIAPASFYIRTLFGRTTPFVLILVAASGLIVFQYWMQHRRLPFIAWLLLFTLGYLILITLPAKKADRYALPALVMTLVIAGWVFAAAIPLFRKYLSLRAVVAACLIVAGALVAQVHIWSPYAVAYSNPFFDIRSRTQQGWGEGLDAAAAWLNGQPVAETMYVASWYPGVLQTYYKGPVLSLSSRHDHRVGYVVTYRNMESRAEDDIASNVLDEFVNQQPVHTVYIGGEPYVWIYQTIGPYYFPQNAGEITGGIEVGQVVPVQEDGWNAIDLAFATFGRDNHGPVTLHIRESLESTEDLRTLTVDASDISDREWQRFTFDPIKDSMGKSYYVAITADNATNGNAITVRYSSSDILAGQAYIRGSLRTADLGYRIP